jgi:predicted nucleic-acid-binding protein
VIALDTNVLARVVTRDDPEQVEKAVEVMRSGPLWVSKTVLLELEWVLRYSYELSREVIDEVLLKLLGLDGLAVEDRDAVSTARAWYRNGMDFADALHLASSREARSFATFDRKLAANSRRFGGTPEVLLL